MANTLHSVINEQQEAMNTATANPAGGTSTSSGYVSEYTGDQIEKLLSKVAEVTNSGETSISTVGQTTAEGGEIFNDYVDNIATGNYAHAEGVECTASGYASHAEGETANASGDISHAEGTSTASGARSHAENSSTAAGDFSHAGGISSSAARRAQFVHGDSVALNAETTLDSAVAFGRYNNPDSKALFAIGNGAVGNKITYVKVAYNALEQSKIEDGYYYAVDIDDDDLAPVYIPLNPGNVGEYTGHYQDFIFYEKIVETMENPLRQNAFEVYEDGHAEVQTANIENTKAVITLEALKKFLVVQKPGESDPDAADYPEGALWIKPID